jgi:hypothetical protein
MSATHPDGSYSVAIEEAQLTAARTQRMAQDQKAENAQLIKRVAEVERIMAQIQVRLDALEALADVVIDQPIPYDLPEAA